MDHCTCNNAYHTLSLLQKDDVIVVGLHEHTQRVLQPLVVRVFGPAEQFKRLLSHRKVSMAKTTRDSIYTICELLYNAYYKPVTSANIFSWFQRCVLWNQATKYVDPGHIRSQDYILSTIRPSCVQDTHEAIKKCNY